MMRSLLNRRLPGLLLFVLVPMVLLADAQTTGGYPKIGVVIRADLWKLAQLRLGATLRFLPCTREEAVAALRDREAELDALKVALCLST